MKYNFATELSSATGEFIRARVAALTADGFSTDEGNKQFSSELYIFSRIAEFPFERYPDYTAPWHLFRWPHMRWDHVYIIITILEIFRQPTGANVGGPIVLQPFQIMILLAFLGPEDPDTGLRLVREGLLTLGRKNGKTAVVAGMSAAIMSLHPDDHGLKGQEIQVGAADREQAGITHMMAERFVQLDRTLGLRDKYRSVPSKKLLQNTVTMSQLRCLSSDAHRHLGGNPVMVLLDEIGGVTNTHAEEFYSALTTGFGAQEEPLTIMFSTQAPTDQHFFSQQVDRMKRVNEGMLEDMSLAGFVFIIPEQDDDGNDVDCYDEGTWYLANPGIDSIMSRADMRDWAKRARDLPALGNKFENLKCNRRVSQTAAFLSRRVWASNNVSFDPTDLYGRTCYLGLDLSETTDLSSLVALFEPCEATGGRMAILPYFWIPGENMLERVRRDKVPYDVWDKQGLIDTASSRTIDYVIVADKIIEMIDEYDVRALGYDRYKMKYVAKALADKSYEWTEEDQFLHAIGQGFKDQSRSVELLETLAINENLAHGNHPILQWCMSNTVIVRDTANGRKFSKTQSFGRIDGVVALALAAHVRDLIAIDAPKDSIYNDMSLPATAIM